MDSLFLFLFFLSCVSFSVGNFNTNLHRLPQLYINKRSFSDLRNPECKAYNEPLLIKEDGLAEIEMSFETNNEFDCSLFGTFKDENQRVTKLSLFQRRIFHDSILKTINLKFCKGYMHNETMLASLRQDVIFEFICANSFYFCLSTSLDIPSESASQLLPDCQSPPPPQRIRPKKVYTGDPPIFVGEHSRFVPSIDYILINNMNISEFNMFSSQEQVIISVANTEEIQFTVVTSENKDTAVCSLLLQTDEQINARRGSMVFERREFLKGELATFETLNDYIPPGYFLTPAAEGGYAILYGHVFCDHNVHYWFMYNVTRVL